MYGTRHVRCHWEHACTLYVGPVPHRGGDVLLWEMAVVSTVVMLWRWQRGVSPAQEASSYPQWKPSAKTWSDCGLPGPYVCDNGAIGFQVCPLKSAAVALLMGQTRGFRKFVCLVVLVGCQTFLRNTISRRKFAFSAV